MADIKDVNDAFKGKNTKLVTKAVNKVDSAAASGCEALAYLTKFNNFLEKVPLSIVATFEALNSILENSTQEYVDIVCRYLARGANIMIEWVRQKIITYLWQQYTKNMVLLDTVNIVKKVLTNPIGAIGDFIGIFTRPIANIIKFITGLIKEIARLADNLAKIASMRPPEPPNPRINFNAFKIRVNSITMGEVIGGPAALKPPEQMFPEEINPFSPQAFQTSFETAAPEREEAKIKYKSAIGELKNKDTGSTTDN